MSDTPETATKIIAPEILASEFTHTEDIGQLTAAMSLAQGAYQPAAQTGFNPHFNKNHSDLEDVMAVIKGPFAANGLAVFQPPWNKSDGKTVTVVTIIAHKSNQWIRTSLTCGVQANNPQSMGSVVTYLRRYELMGMAGVTSRGDDDDGETGAGRGPNTGAPSPAAQRQAPASKPASQGAPTGTALPQPATIPEAVVPFAKRFDEAANKEEFDALLKSTRETFDAGTAEHKAYVVAVKRAMTRLGIQPKAQTTPAPTTGATP